MNIPEIEPPSGKHIWSEQTSRGCSAALRVAVLSVFAAFGCSPAFAADFEFRVLAQTGAQSGISSIKTTSTPSVSINDGGQVAFVGARAGGGEGIFVADSYGVKNITPSYSSYTFASYVQINNNGLVVSRTSRGSPSIFSVSAWDSAIPDSRLEWIRTSTGPISYCLGGSRAGEACSSEFDCPGIPPNVGQLWGCRTISNAYQSVLFATINNEGQTAFIGSAQTVNYLVTAGPSGEARTMAGTMRLPMIADSGAIVARSGSSATSPIRLFSQNLSSPIDVAPIGTTFSSVGQYPGISDSGEFVAFYGDRVGEGPGIFVYYVESGDLVRVASLRTAAPEDSNIVASLVPDVRVSVNNHGVVIFQGSNASGQSAVFRVITRRCNNQIVTMPVAQVVAVGDSIKGAPGTVSQLYLFDSLNNKTPGDICFLATMSPSGAQAVVKATRKTCDVCSTCPAGGVRPANNSVDVTVGLGASLDGSVVGSLNIYADAPSTNLASPAGLTVSSGGFSTIYANGQLRQVRGRHTLADINVITPFRYEISFYTNAGPLNSGTGLFPPAGVAFSTVTVENPDGGTSANRLRVTRDNGDVTTYVFHPEYQGWELITGFANGTRKEALERSTNGTQRTETKIIRDSADAVVSHLKSVYETFAWGEELVQTIEDPAGAAKTTVYTYYTNSATDGNNHGRVRSIRYPNGRWEFYKEYHPVHGLLKSVSQFRSNPYTESASWPEPENRSFEFSRVGNVETTTDYLKGHPISRRWHVEPSRGLTIDSIATHPAITNWFDPANLFTTNFQYLASNTNGARAGQSAWTINPDGTMTIHAYFDEFIADSAYFGNGTPPQIEILRTVTWTGAANSNYTQVVDGNVSAEVTDLLGNLIQRHEWDIASGVLTGSETVTAQDSFGRATRTDYLDGTYVTRSYDCCGLVEQTDREGIVTIYNTDKTVRLDLTGDDAPETYHGSSVERAGIATHTLTDALGRAFTTVIEGTNGALIVQDERHYNILGELDWSKDAMGRTTIYSHGETASFTLNSTTFPDGSQSIAASWQDGSAYETKGEAVQGLRYSADVVDDNGVWVQASTQTRLEKDGTPSPEYTTTFTDFAGRAYKTQYPWPDGGTNVFAFTEYNAKGQLVRSADPEGISTLYEYNARGEMETTAIDIANPWVIDFAGADRITRTRSWVSTNSLHGIPVRTVTTEVWENDGLDEPTFLQKTETSMDGQGIWSTQYGLTTRTLTINDRNLNQRTVVTLNPDQTTVTNVYTLGRSSSITRYDSNSVQVAGMTFDYDAFGRMRAQTDARNGATLYTYYDDGQIHTVTTPDPETEQSGPGYDPQTTTYTYFRDPVNGIKTVTTLPDSEKVTQQFYPSGQLKKTWGARTYPAAYTYDRAGRVETLTTWQQFDFNTGNGLSGAATTKWHYNSRGLLAFKEYADGKGPTYSYTAGGKLNTRLWARGVSTTYGYDPKSGDLLTLTYSDTTPAVTNAYDRLGRFKSVDDASGTRQFGYQNGQTTTEAYTSGMFAGITLQRGLDSLHRLRSLVVTNAMTNLYHVGYAYDAASRLQTVTSGPDVATYGYHTNADLVNTLVQSHSNQIRLITTKIYDKLNRLQSISNVPSAGSPISFAYQYNDANKRTRATLANGEYWTYGYDALGQVTNGVKRFPNNAPIPGYTFGYQFDHIGNRLASTRDNRTDAYTNNALNQIQTINYAPWLHVLGQVNSNADITVNGQTPVRSNGYFYAQLGATSIWDSVSIQARVMGAATNGADALAEESGHLSNLLGAPQQKYDDDGNMLWDGRLHYTWDGENRIIRKEVLTPQSAQRRLEYALDAQGRRVRVRLFEGNSVAWTHTADHKYVASAFDLLTELDEPQGNGVSRSFIWGLDLFNSRRDAGGVGAILSFSEQNKYFAVSDGNGNVSAGADAASGGESAHYEYDPFGRVLRVTGIAGRLNPFRYSTKFYEDETGDIHFENRDFRPEFGRWLSVDPLGDSVDANLYGFARNDPIALFDLLGLTTVGQVLNQFFSTSTEEGLWIMLEGDSYTTRVRQWQPVKNVIQEAKRELERNCATWKVKHATTPSWRPQAKYSRHEKNWDDHAWRRSPQSVDIPGTDVKTARNNFLIYLTTGYQTDALYTSSIGSFDLNVTVDCVDCSRGKAMMRFWKYNGMSEESFGSQNKYFPKPGSSELAQRNREIIDFARRLLPGYPSLFYQALLYRVPWSGSGKAVQHMWWNWTEEHNWQPAN